MKKLSFTYGETWLCHWGLTIVNVVIVNVCLVGPKSTLSRFDDDYGDDDGSDRGSGGD